MNNPFIQTIASLSAYRELKKALADAVTPVSASGVSGVHKAQLIFALSSELSRRCLVIADDEGNARRLCDDINSMAGTELAALYPSKEIYLNNAEGVSREYEHMRLSSLSRFVSGTVSILVCSAEAAMQKTLPPDELSDSTVLLKRGDSISIEELERKLLRAGYSRFEKVENTAQFAVRGAIVDIFPTAAVAPFRIELWGDEIDTIASFDTETQRRTEQMTSVLIPPASETIFDSQLLAARLTAAKKSLRGKHREQVAERLDADIELLSAGTTPADIDKYYNFMYIRPADVLSYADSDCLCVVSELADCVSRGKGIMLQHNEELAALTEEGIIFRGAEGFYTDFSEIVDKIGSMRTLCLDNFIRGGSQLPYKRLFSVNALQGGTWGGDIRQLNEEIPSYIENGYKVILAVGNEKTLPTICSDLSEGGIPCEIWNEETQMLKGRVYLVGASLSGGYEYPEIRSAMITANKQAPVRRKIKKPRKAEEIRSLSDIAIGDLVVHALYGIGHYGGIRKLELEGITKDYIIIKYKGSDVLYVPVTQMDMVSKYIGARDDSRVKINSLSSTEWQKTRSKVKSAVKDMAKELIALYAKRQSAKGYAFDEDDRWQTDFEERFEYIETGDQLRSIDEIKSDMQQPRPMDRLLCGDVGFGKTEVAFRAAFKCVMSGKQCAILAPTTVLAWQHYQTAIRRFEHFPVNIENISRFRTPKQQREILRKLKGGEIDIIIGTHRLVQKDVAFNDLGLAIIDEEQRFGVAHKEKFKQMYAGIDMLTLSATPIPRTLNMAMSGIRDMSVIEEPPQDRYPVQTYVIEHDLGVIAQACVKEIKRGGQIYYIHNRIESITTAAGRLSRMLPDARIAVAHGQMSEEEMSEVWRQLLDREIDILVCTTIIETGVDVPNVNTLVIEDADCFGLSQLYQLRGRVGRSTRRAYAYLTFRPNKALSEIAQKRLETIREFTQFGSGFRIAMRDLEIRGAGNLFGAKQHGHMDSVGYDMYLRLLSEAIAEEKGETPPPSACDCVVDIQIEAHIPEKYIASTEARLDMYRKIAAVRSESDQSDLIDELIDRYGDPPKALLGLISVALLRNKAANLGITEITQRSGNLLFYTSNMQIDRLSSLSAAYKGRLMFNNMGKQYVSVKPLDNQRAIELIGEFLERCDSLNNVAKM